jgi:hypothetical protein
LPAPRVALTARRKDHDTETSQEIGGWLCHASEALDVRWTKTCHPHILGLSGHCQASHP